MEDHCVHHNIEYGGRQCFPLKYASLSGEGFSTVPPRLYHHLKLPPIPAEEAEGTGTQAISLQDVEVSGIIDEFNELRRQIASGVEKW